MHYNNTSLTNHSSSGMPYLPEPIGSPYPGPQTIDEYVDDDYLLTSPIQAPYSTTPTIYSGIGNTFMDAGWWVCSECKSMNNPALAPERCSVCQHYKCGSCSNNVAPPAL